MATLQDIDGITSNHVALLKEAGITSCEALLNQGAKPADRKRIADMLGMEAEAITRCFNQADLYRIKGIGAVYANLLEYAGVDTVPELATRNAENLHHHMTTVAESKTLASQLPTLETVQDWIGQAKALPRALHY